jgi:hypothetical protein
MLRSRRRRRRERRWDARFDVTQRQQVTAARKYFVTFTLIRAVYSYVVVNCCNTYTRFLRLARPSAQHELTATARRRCALEPERSGEGRRVHATRVHCNGYLLRYLRASYGNVNPLTFMENSIQRRKSYFSIFTGSANKIRSPLKDNILLHIFNARTLVLKVY